MKAKGYRVFVDDMRPIPDGWIGSRTVSETISLLATLPVREISLDHDILFPTIRGEGYYTPLMNETFKGVAYYIAAMPEAERPERIRVHTSNAGAAKTMCDIMGLDFAATYTPFNVKDYTNGEKVL